MLQCEKCGRKFKSSSALGGHVVNAHGEQKEEPAPQGGVRAPQGGEGGVEVAEPALSEAEGPAQSASGDGAQPVALAQPVSDEESQAAQIRDYLRKGYTFEQLTRQFGFKETTVRRELEKAVAPKGRPVDEEDRRGDDGLPVVRKMGQGVEVITPEAVLRRYMDGDQDQAELRGMMKLRAAMLMVMDLINMRKADAEAFALEVKPILDLMKEGRVELDASAQRARASVDDAAKLAAQEAAEQVAGYLDQRLSHIEEKKPDIAQAARPFEGVMARTMERLMDNMMDRLTPGAGHSRGQGLPPGWEEERSA